MRLVYDGVTGTTTTSGSVPVVYCDLLGGYIRR